MPQGELWSASYISELSGPRARELGSHLPALMNHWLGPPQKDIDLQTLPGFHHCGQSRQAPLAQPSEIKMNLSQERGFKRTERGTDIICFILQTNFH